MRDYNFFESYQKKRNVSIDVKSPVFLGMIVILLILAVSAYCVAQNFILGLRLASASVELAEIQSSKEYQEAIMLQDSITAMAQFDQDAGSALQRINNSKILNTKFMQKLSGVIPSTVSFQTVNLTQSNASLNFYVPNEKAAAELVGNLDQSGLFLQASLVSVTKSEEAGNYIASINCIIKAGDQE
jgi:type IV pilus assembly protein PilN